jgi:hypothetical protein
MGPCQKRIWITTLMLAVSCTACQSSGSQPSDPGTRTDTPQTSLSPSATPRAPGTSANRAPEARSSARSPSSALTNAPCGSVPPCVGGPRGPNGSYSPSS